MVHHSDIHLRKGVVLPSARRDTPSSAVCRRALDASQKCQTTACPADLVHAHRAVGGVDVVKILVIGAQAVTKRLGHQHAIDAGEDKPEGKGGVGCCGDRLFAWQA